MKQFSYIAKSQNSNLKLNWNNIQYNNEKSLFMSGVMNKFLLINFTYQKRGRTIINIKIFINF